MTNWFTNAEYNQRQERVWFAYFDAPLCGIFTIKGRNYLFYRYAFEPHQTEKCFIGKVNASDLKQMNQKRDLTPYLTTHKKDLLMLTIFLDEERIAFAKPTSTQLSRIELDDNQIDFDYLRKKDLPQDRLF